MRKTNKINDYIPYGKKMNKRGTIQKTLGMGIIIGIMGFIIMAFGSATDNPWLMRGGIVAITFATWLITWK